MKIVATTVSTFMISFMRLDDRREVDVHGRGRDFACGLDRVLDARKVVADVLEVAVRLFVDQLALASQRTDDVALRTDDAVQLHEPAADSVEPCRSSGAGLSSSTSSISSSSSARSVDDRQNRCRPAGR